MRESLARAFAGPFRLSSLTFIVSALIVPTASAGWIDFVIDVGGNPFKRKSVHACVKYIKNFSARNGSIDGPRFAVNRLRELVESGRSDFKTQVEPQLLVDFDGSTRSFRRDQEIELLKLWAENADEDTVMKLLANAPEKSFEAGNAAGDQHNGSNYLRFLFDVSARLGFPGESRSYFEALDPDTFRFILNNSYLGGFSDEGIALRKELSVEWSVARGVEAMAATIASPEKLGSAISEGNLSLDYGPSAKGFIDERKRNSLKEKESNDPTSLADYRINSLYRLLHHRLNYALTEDDPAVHARHNVHFDRYSHPVGFREQSLPDPELKVRGLYSYANGVAALLRDTIARADFDGVKEDYLRAIEGIDPKVIEFIENYDPSILPALNPEYVSANGLSGIEVARPRTLTEALEP